MKMKKFLALTATVAMVASMAVGCGNSGNSDKTDGKAETEFDAANDISVVSREDGSGTRGAFIELFGIEEKDASGEKVDNTTEGLTLQIVHPLFYHQWLTMSMQSDMFHLVL